MEEDSIELQTTAMQTDPEDEEPARGSSGLSWPSSYRSSRLLTPDTQRLLDSQAVHTHATTPTTKMQPLKLPMIHNDVIKEEKTGFGTPLSQSLDTARSGDTNYSSDSVKIPPLKCSLYTVIGNPSLAKRRKNKPAPTVHWPKDGRKSRPGLSQKWKRGNNELDNNTIYSTKQQKYYDSKVSNPNLAVLPPIEVSQRSDSQNKADAQTVKEKEIVMRNFFLTGKMKRFEENKAVLPSVYKQVLDNSAKRQTYVSTLYNHQLERRRERERERSIVDCTKRLNMPDEQCEFCDVMGNRYCSYCIEFKNRHFALGYEKNFLLPQLPRRKRAGNHLASFLINANDGLGPVNKRR